jgi:hypothetical protein
MKVWSSALAGEVTTWPRVKTRLMFGFTALYRAERIFAVLPRTRGVETAASLAFKLEGNAPSVRARLEKDVRIGSTQMQKARWFTFELRSDGDLHAALSWLEQAYRAASKRKRSR